MKFSTKHPSNMTCSAGVRLSPKVRDRREGKKTTAGIKSSQRIYSGNQEANSLTQTKPIQTKRAVLTLAFRI